MIHDLGLWENLCVDCCDVMVVNGMRTMLWCARYYYCYYYYCVGRRINFRLARTY